MSKNRYTFATELDGFINLGEPSGKFNNCSFAFTVPEDVLTDMEKDREELLAWAKTKAGRVSTNLPKWDDSGLIKYSFDGDTGRKRPHFVDTDGDVVDLSVLKSVRKGTKVRIVCQQTPYTKPAMGTTIKVLGVQIVELVSGNGAVDSGDLSAADVAAMFGKVDGFKAETPVVRDEREEEVSSDSYDF